MEVLPGVDSFVSIVEVGFRGVDGVVTIVDDGVGSVQNNKRQFDFSHWWWTANRGLPFLVSWHRGANYWRRAHPNFTPCPHPPRFFTVVHRYLKN